MTVKKLIIAVAVVLIFVAFVSAITAVEKNIKERFEQEGVSKPTIFCKRDKKFQRKRSFYLL